MAIKFYVDGCNELEEGLQCVIMYISMSIDELNPYVIKVVTLKLKNYRDRIKTLKVKIERDCSCRSDY